MLGFIYSLNDKVRYSIVALLMLIQFLPPLKPVYRLLPNWVYTVTVLSLLYMKDHNDHNEANNDNDNVTGPSDLERLSNSEISKMSSKQLIRELKKRKVPCNHCVEKKDLQTLLTTVAGSQKSKND